MNTNIFVPKKINVGFQNRKDTYSGKLAYVIYFDEKGKLRKETSWNGWRDENIPNEIYDNEPTEGFVLNKKVGGVEECWGWDPRKTYTRVYDPRGFEFEITIPNLLWILENCNCIKGKGLDGEFVYGWDGKELLLMPVDSPDYKQIAEYNRIVHSNESIRVKDLIVGATYLTKYNQEIIYIGKFDLYSYGENCGKQFYFAYKNDKNAWDFEVMKSIPKNRLITCVDNKCTSEYADIFEALQYKAYYSPHDPSKDVFFYLTLEEFVNASKFEAYDETIRNQSVNFISEYGGIKRTYTAYPPNSTKNEFILKKLNTEGYSQYYYNWEDELTIFPTEEKEISTYWYYQKKMETKMIPVPLEQIYTIMKPIGRQEYLQNGKEFRKVWVM